MTIVLTVNSVIVTDKILIDSLAKEDSIYEQKDTLKFSVALYGIYGFVPVKGQEVLLTIDGVTEFGGKIISVGKSITAGQMIVYDVFCVDYSQQFENKIVNERYDSTSILNIVSSLISRYTTGFTTTNVVCGIEVETITFNKISLSECIKRLADTVGYSWYVDYDKDVHFFEKGIETAPFGITDSNGKYLQNTLKLKDDLSQLRNKIIIRGGEERGVARTEVYVADGEQTTFPLVNKFAEKPSLYVQDEVASSTIGIDFLNVEADFDCFWDFGQKYIRFKTATKPALNKKVEITGIPLFSVLASVQDNASIVTYGLSEIVKKDDRIRSTTEAQQIGNAELLAYKDGVIEGSFQTDSSGLRSGQQININSTLLGLNENFLIQKVSLKILASDKAIWSVQLATLRTVGMLEMLRELLRKMEIRTGEEEGLVSLTQFADNVILTDLLSGTSKTSPPYVWEESGTPEVNHILWNFFTWTAG